MFGEKSAPKLGVKNGKLTECPSSPNCVSTQTASESHKMQAIPFSKELDVVMTQIKAVVNAMGSATLVKEQRHYLHFEFKTSLLKFIDDVEFFIDEKSKLIHFRSASRVGYSDLGANRSRMSEIKQNLQKSLN